MYHPIRILGQLLRQVRVVRSEAGVSIREQIRQLVACRRAAGIARAEFFKYRLWRPELDEVDRLSYLSQREVRVVGQVTHLRIAGEPRLLGKSDTVERLASSGIPVPETLGWINGDRDGAIRGQGALAQLLSAIGAGGVVIKPEQGLQGTDVMVALSATAAGLNLASGESLSIEELWKLTGGSQDTEWRIERRVEADANVTNWWPGTTPTVRILTLLLDEGPVVHGASVRIPNNSSGVDNLAKGNLVATVNLESGVVGRATDGSGIRWYSRHPANDSPISGVLIHRWSEYLDVARAGALILPRWRTLGWDLAISQDGPVVLEANAPWCEKVVQLPAESGIVRGAFIRLMHQAGGGAMFSGRRKQSRQWRAVEEEALDGPVPSPLLPD